tara:strand:+ start:436 stop:750 length:315 start_codon:yes stop_codon:yes gene_type:complete
MIVLNYILPPLSYQEWHTLSRLDQIQVESPPKHLHLEIDITKLNKNDINWVQEKCSHIVPELVILFNEYNQKEKQYQESIQSYEKKIKEPKIIKKQRKKAPKVY